MIYKEGDYLIPGNEYDINTVYGVYEVYSIDGYYYGLYSKNCFYTISEWRDLKLKELLDERYM